MEDNPDVLSWFKPLLFSSGSLVLTDISSGLGTLSIIASLYYVLLKIYKEHKGPPNPPNPPNPTL